MENMQEAVYSHLYNMNEHIVSSVFPKITPELSAIMSYDAYAETIQMAQSGILKDYYERLKRNAV